MVSSSYIGRFSFIGRDCYLPNVEIGRFCSIGNNVQVVAETHPSSGFRSTHPAFYSTGKQCGITFVKESLFNERLSIKGRSCIIGNFLLLLLSVLLMDISPLLTNDFLYLYNYSMSVLLYKY